ncbi:MAG: hypothetical protein MJA29_12915 [Candidatus Omnitrophica bacterium]|nr:hypothetical protein [Candidatus Omnitrophota bacterium]
MRQAYVTGRINQIDRTSNQRPCAWAACAPSRRRQGDPALSCATRVAPAVGTHPRQPRSRSKGPTDARPFFFLLEAGKRGEPAAYPGESTPCQYIRSDEAEHRNRTVPLPRNDRPHPPRMEPLNIANSFRRRRPKPRSEAGLLDDQAR